MGRFVCGWGWGVRGAVDRAWDVGGGELLFEPVESLGKDQARVVWRVAEAGGANHSGVDTFSVLAGRITHQLTELDGEDF
mgnify:CR=1 FL=1